MKKLPKLVAELFNRMFRLKGLFKVLLMEQISFNSSEAGIPSTLAGSAQSLNF